MLTLRSRSDRPWRCRPRIHYSGHASRVALGACDRLENTHFSDVDGCLPWNVDVFASSQCDILRQRKVMSQITDDVRDVNLEMHVGVVVWQTQPEKRHPVIFVEASNQLRAHERFELEACCAMISRIMVDCDADSPSKYVD